MIVVYHNNIKVIKVFEYENNKELSFIGKTIQEVLILTAKDNKTLIIGWCHVRLKEEIDILEWKSVFKHSLIMASFEVAKHFFINSSIGYVEDSPFIKVNKKVNYPTWLMSSDVGAIHASVLLKFEKLLKHKLSFSYFLNSVSKIGMKKGLLCYSVPSLIKKSKLVPTINKNTISKTEMFQFLKSNYKKRWQFIYLINNLLYKQKFLLWPLLKSLFKKKINCEVNFTDIKNENKNDISNPSIDVLIPTLGRASYLKDVLIDLSNQTLLPTKVIIIEQNLDINNSSELDFLSDKWPFKIDHTFIHQLGACNARNIALQKVTSDWAFFADDDIRLNNNVLENSFKYINLYGAKAVTLSCLQKNEIEKNKVIHQWLAFGSGTSIVKLSSLKNLKFDLAYEFGYGEDGDFGMQLRNNGIDILYIPSVKMLHLKAPIGGFRKKIINEWDDEYIQPKPSPTIMVFKLKHATKEQLQGYKTILFFKFYKVQSIKSPFKYYKIMNKRWRKSIFWANWLINKS
ncbi:MAG: glycosyl transferase [Flavobacteriaceae bacterium]|nr:MAG: glycosyl transferase [Flavobacteriaceae bacterium]